MNPYPSPASAASIASRLPAPSDYSLLLGWHAGASSARPFGFVRPDAPALDEGAPLVYEGDGHLLSIAPTGKGKGRGDIIPNLLRYPGPVIVIDPKGENYAVTARRRREMGHRVIALDPFHMVTDHTDQLNPFDLFRLAGSTAESDAEMLAELLAGTE